MVSHDDVLMPRVKTVKLETEFNVVGLVSVCCWGRFR